MTRKGFTLMEILTVVVLAGVMAAVAVPSFTKTIDKARARDVVNNLYVIGAAQTAHRSRYGSYYLPAGMNSVSSINAALGLNIIQQQGAQYMCSSSFGPAGGCNGFISGKWTYQIQPPYWQPACTSMYAGHPCPSGVP